MSICPSVCVVLECAMHTTKDNQLFQTVSIPVVVLIWVKKRNAVNIRLNQAILSWSCKKRIINVLHCHHTGSKLTATDQNGPNYWIGSADCKDRA